MCIFRFHGSNPLILTVLVLQSTDLRPEITFHCMCTHTHLSMHRTLYGVVSTACTIWSHCLLNSNDIKHSNVQTRRDKTVYNPYIVLPSHWTDKLLLLLHFLHLLHGDTHTRTRSHMYCSWTHLAESTFWT